MKPEYDFELNKIISEIKKNKAKLVGLQFPEGLKDRAVEIANAVEKETKTKTVTFIDPIYGACDLREQDAEKLGLDMIVHFGHTEIFKRRG